MKLLILIIISLTFNTYAAEITIVQASKSFLEQISDDTAKKVMKDEKLEEKHKVKVLKLNQGDSLKFLNRDRVAHNVRAVKKDRKYIDDQIKKLEKEVEKRSSRSSYETSSGIDEEEFFDVKLQKPGEDHDKSVELNKKGAYEVQCRIHPKMKILLTVD